MKMVTPKQYSEALKLRDSLKKVNQLSWKFNQFDKRYPIENVDDAKTLQDIMDQFRQWINEAFEEFKKLKEENEAISNEMNSQKMKHELETADPD